MQIMIYDYDTQKWKNWENWAQLRQLRTHSSRLASQSQTSCPTSGANMTTEQRLTLSSPAMRGSCEQTQWKASPRSNQSTRSTRSPWSLWTGRKSRWWAWSRLVGTIIIIFFILLTLGWQDQGGTRWCAKFPFNCSSSTTRGLWGSTTLAKTASHLLKVKLYLCQLLTNGHLQAKQPDILGSPRSNKVAFIFYSRHCQERNQPKY